MIKVLNSKYTYNVLDSTQLNRILDDTSIVPFQSYRSKSRLFSSAQSSGEADQVTAGPAVTGPQTNPTGGLLAGPMTAAGQSNTFYTAGDSTPRSVLTSSNSLSASNIKSGKVRIVVYAFFDETM